MRERTEQKSQLRTIEVVLRWAWDPIGVRGIEGAADEYDSYAPPVLSMLQRAVSDQEVADYLTSIEVDRMGLNPTANKNSDIAALLRELHAISRADPDGGHHQ